VPPLQRLGVGSDGGGGSACLRTSHKIIPACFVVYFMGRSPSLLVEQPGPLLLICCGVELSDTILKNQARLPSLPFSPLSFSRFIIAPSASPAASTSPPSSAPAAPRCPGSWPRPPRLQRRRRPSARPLREPSCGSPQPPLLPRAGRWASRSSSRLDLCLASTNKCVGFYISKVGSHNERITPCC
jgi:hypothetical protein